MVLDVCNDSQNPRLACWMVTLQHSTTQYKTLTVTIKAAYLIYDKGMHIVFMLVVFYLTRQNNICVRALPELPSCL